MTTKELIKKLVNLPIQIEETEVIIEDKVILIKTSENEVFYIQ